MSKYAVQSLAKVVAMERSLYRMSPCGVFVENHGAALLTYITDLETQLEGVRELADSDVVIPRYMLDFLLGQGPLEGFWFGDKPATERGEYWWRKRLLWRCREALDAPKPASDAGEE